MDPNLADFLHLGFRFYEPQVGRFGQRDSVVNHRQTAYQYASLLPTRRTDPDGRQDDEIAFTIPTLVKQASCDRIGYGRQVDEAIDWAQKYWVKHIVTELSLLCPKEIAVNCHKSNGITKYMEWGGFGIPYMSIRIFIPLTLKDGTAVPIGCQILHEMVHVCGKIGHGWMKHVSVPGCPESIL